MKSYLIISNFCYTTSRMFLRRLGDRQNNHQIDIKILRMDFIAINYYLVKNLKK